eukprot:1194163-Prorocentrum_minimum.AAC.3
MNVVPTISYYARVIRLASVCSSYTNSESWIMLHNLSICARVSFNNCFRVSYSRVSGMLPLASILGRESYPLPTVLAQSSSTQGGIYHKKCPSEMRYSKWEADKMLPVGRSSSLSASPCRASVASTECFRASRPLNCDNMVGYVIHLVYTSMNVADQVIILALA